MKKLFLSALMVFGLLLLAGCGKEQVLRCKATESGVDVGYNVTFKGARITKMNLTYDMNLSAYSDQQIDLLRQKDFCEVVQNAMSQYKEAFENCTQSIESKNLHVYSDLNVDKITNNELEKLSSITKSKEGLEEVGYTCTIE